MSTSLTVHSSAWPTVLTSCRSSGPAHATRLRRSAVARSGVRRIVGQRRAPAPTRRPCRPPAARAPRPARVQKPVHARLRADARLPPARFRGRRRPAATTARPSRGRAASLPPLSPRRRCVADGFVSRARERRLRPLFGERQQHADHRDAVGVAVMHPHDPGAASLGSARRSALARADARDRGGRLAEVRAASCSSSGVLPGRARGDDDMCVEIEMLVVDPRGAERVRLRRAGESAESTAGGSR